MQCEHLCFCVSSCLTHKAVIARVIECRLISYFLPPREVALQCTAFQQRKTQWLHAIKRHTCKLSTCWLSINLWDMLAHIQIYRQTKSTSRSSVHCTLMSTACEDHCLTAVCVVAADQILSSWSGVHDRCADWIVSVKQSQRRAEYFSN